MDGTPRCELAERRNMLFMGTSVSKGRAEAIVVATGMATEIGDIAAMIQQSGEELTPLQRRLEQLGRWLVLVCLVVVGLVFAAGVARGLSVYDMFLTGVSLAVAAIPEGLPGGCHRRLRLGRAAHDPSKRHRQATARSRDPGMRDRHLFG